MSTRLDLNSIHQKLPAKFSGIIRCALRSLAIATQLSRSTFDAKPEPPNDARPKSVKPGLLENNTASQQTLCDIQINLGPAVTMTPR